MKVLVKTLLLIGFFIFLSSIAMANEQKILTCEEQMQKMLKSEWEGIWFDQRNRLEASLKVKEEYGMTVVYYSWGDCPGWNTTRGSSSPVAITECKKEGGKEKLVLFFGSLSQKIEFYISGDDMFGTFSNKYGTVATVRMHSVSPKK
jgi:hypothetical protein